MIKLQNNFTTPEQSKRLLALGLPEDSADCYIDFGDGKRYIREPFDYETILGQSFFEYYNRIFIPVWSVGRLIEIMALCYKFDLPSSGSICIYTTDVKKGSVVDVLISDIERHISRLDFSKLEEE